MVDILQTLTDRDAMEAKSDFWSMTGNYAVGNHVVPGRQFPLPKADFPIPLRFCEIYRQTTNPNVFGGESIVGGENSFSDLRIGVTRFTILSK